MRSHILSTASLQKALGNSSPGTYKKKDSKRRSSRKSDSATVTKTEQPTSQWYTTTEISHSSIQQTPSPVTSLISNLHSSTHVFELRQELTPKRPLRSEVEKERRMSNRWSGQSHYLRNINNGLEPSGLGKGNRDSVGTTDSTASEDDPPPPLPIKMREADYCNLPEEVSTNRCATTLNNLNKSSGQWKNKLPTPTDDDVDSQAKPPTPPPKPKRPIHNLNRNVLATNDVENSPVEDSSIA